MAFDFLASARSISNPSSQIPANRWGVVPDAARHAQARVCHLRNPHVVATTCSCKMPSISSELSSSLFPPSNHRTDRSFSSLGSFSSTYPQRNKNARKRAVRGSQRSWRRTGKHRVVEQTHSKPSANHPPTTFSLGGYHDGCQRIPRSETAKVEHVDNENSASVSCQASSLSALRGVDVPSIPSGQSSRRTTIFVGQQAQTLLDKARIKNPSISSRMHRPVNKDDYLLARGANPRTGVVTPGSHSASSSVDAIEAAEAQDVPSQSRWRQRGDQWISLDQDALTASRTPPSERSSISQPRGLRVPQKLSTGPHFTSVSGADAPTSHYAQSPTSRISSGIRRPTHNRGPSDAISSFPPLNQNTSTQADPCAEPDSGGKMRRKPVGSPPSRDGADQHSTGHGLGAGSAETILRKTRFNVDQRSSSAPLLLPMRQGHPRNMNKELPAVPTESLTAHLPGAIQGHDPFLDTRAAASMQSSVPSSKTRNTSGRLMVDKELPCRPTSSGPSQLKQQQQVPHSTTTAEKRAGSQTQLAPLAGPPETPKREEAAAYRDLRKAMPMYSAPPTVRPVLKPGERVMPVPVYDNPPKRLSPLMRLNGPRAEGPRPMRPADVRRPIRVQDDFDLSSNTTTIPTGMSMGRPNVPRPLQIGSDPMRNDPRRTPRGPRGFPQRPYRAGESDIIMNTGMNTFSDTMMSVPLPRVRPRAMTRPQMPVRAEGMYGIPTFRPHHIASSSMGEIGPPPSWLPRDPPRLVPTSEPPETRATNLVPEPLKPRVPTGPRSTTNLIRDLNEKLDMSNGLGLIRKCSRCHHGFVDVKLHNTDSVIRTSDPLKDGEGAKEGSKALHSGGRSLPGLPEEEDSQKTSSGRKQILDVTASKKDLPDEPDHSECCPDCCKEDCHDSCLGHASPSSTPSPTKSSIWSEAQSPSSASETDEWEPVEFAQETNPKEKLSGLAFVRSALRLSPKKQGSKFDHGRAKFVPRIRMSPAELSAMPRTPATVLDGQNHGAVAAAVTATGQQKANPRHTRARSSSSPVIGVIEPSPQSSMRAASGSRLRVPTPVGLAIGCLGGATRGRNVSGQSTNTIEIAMPGFGSLVGGCETVMVPFEALKMWLRTHPQVMEIGLQLLQRGWAMAQVTLHTGTKLWAVAFVYSKTGKLKLHRAKGETAGGFVVDVARSLLYLLVLSAVTLFVLRVLRVILGFVGIVGLLFRAVFWVLKSVLGVGVVK